GGELPQPIAHRLRPVRRGAGPVGSRRLEGLPDGGHHRVPGRSVEQDGDGGLAEQPVHGGELAAPVGHGFGAGAGLARVESVAVLSFGAGGGGGGLGTASTFFASPATPAALRMPLISTRYRASGVQALSTRRTSLSNSLGRLAMMPSVRESRAAASVSGRPAGWGAGLTGGFTAALSRLVVSFAARMESVLARAIFCRLSSSSLGSRVRKGTMLESACRRRVASRSSKRWVGSSGCEKVSRALRLSAWVTDVSRGPRVSRGRSQRGGTARVPAGTTVESKLSRRSRRRFRIWSSAP